MRGAIAGDENINMAPSQLQSGDTQMRYHPQLAKDSKVFQSGSGWIVERKWDGMRALFQLSENETHIFSRTGQDLRPQFPELLDLHERVGVPCVLDGEIVAMGKDDVEDLELLQLRLNDKLARRQDEVPVQVQIFDVLEVQGTSIIHCPLWQRRNLLLDILEGSGLDMPIVLPPGQEIPSHWEGVVSKRDDSTYQCGKRRSTWLKWKFTHRATLIATGLTPGKGARSSSFGAVTVSDANGVPRGQVGSGFNESSLREIMDRMAAGELVLIEVEYRFLSKTGLMVNTAFKGVRHDKVVADAL